MSESDEANQDDEVEKGLGETISYSQGLNLNSHNTPIHITGVYPFWQANSSRQLHQGSPQYDNNQTYPNMTFFQQPFPVPPYTNMFYQQSGQPPQRQTTRPQVDVNAFPHTTQPPPPPPPALKANRQQSGQLPQHQTTQPQVDVNAFQHTTQQPPPPPPLLKANRRNKTNWTNEADIQLTIAWLRVTTDPAVGVGQKNNTLWERVLRVFVKLMHDRHNMKPEDCVRTAHAVENRMNKIKAHCSKWTAIRARVLGSYKSGWSPEDIVMKHLSRSRGTRWTTVVDSFHFTFLTIPITTDCVNVFVHTTADLPAPLITPSRKYFSGVLAATVFPCSISPVWLL